METLKAHFYSIISFHHLGEFIARPDTEIEQLKDEGLKQYYKMGIAQPGPSWSTLFVIGLVGVFQIGFGVLLVTYSSGFGLSAGWSLIQG
jgi:hypothetical protein